MKRIGLAVFGLAIVFGTTWADEEEFKTAAAPKPATRPAPARPPEVSKPAPARPAAVAKPATVRPSAAPKPAMAARPATVTKPAPHPVVPHVRDAHLQSSRPPASPAVGVQTKPAVGTAGIQHLPAKPLPAASSGPARGLAQSGKPSGPNLGLGSGAGTSGMATPSSGTSGGSSGTTVPPSMSYDPTTGVTFLQSSDVNALAKPGDTYTVSFGRRMDPYGKTNELYGVYSSKAAADKAVAQVKAWADQIKKDDARRGIVKSDWDITTIEVQRSGTKSASNPGKGSFGYDPNGIKTSASGKPAASFGGLMGAISSTRLQWPLKGAIRITTTYGSVDGRHKTPHKGIDIAAPAGSPVYAASGGKVIVSGPVAGFGNAIYVQQPNGVVVIYGHLGSKALMPVGATVSAGELIGKIGTKQEGGHTTGPHLHLQVQPDITKGSTTIDPMQLIAPDQLARPTTSSISKRP